MSQIVCLYLVLWSSTTMNASSVDHGGKQLIPVRDANDVHELGRGISCSTDSSMESSYLESLALPERWRPVVGFLNWSGHLLRLLEKPTSPTADWAPNIAALASASSTPVIDTLNLPLSFSRDQVITQQRTATIVRVQTRSDHICFLIGLGLCDGLL